ncbi:hypothetical protein MVEN_01680700 [Mycena venus]|uniref:GATA-type domain-containing protein n=1 Tax=Mycena venus TaxID=2733690 RepID=A0A8H6XLM8_9AGAR|nr:hypothetical protein MVEN_01680700 [Mycena venus]
MPGILNLKFKGNKSFVAFSNLNDTESLTKTWKVCTKVASYLEQGQRLENLSWRLWHLQNLMVDTDNAKSKREFKKLSKCMGDKLDKEKGRSIEELPAPDFKRNPSTDLIRQRAVEKERTREASQHTPDHIIQRMQFTFAVEPAAPATTTTTTTSSPTTSKNASTTTFPAEKGDQRGQQRQRQRSEREWREQRREREQAQTPRRRLRRCGLLLGLEGQGGRAGRDDDMRIARPTIELPLDELLNAEMEDDEFSANLGMGSEGDGSSEAGSGSGSGSGSGDIEGVKGGDETQWTWDEIMRGASNMHVGMNLFDGSGFYGPTNAPTTTTTNGSNNVSPSVSNNAYDNSAPLTLDPHAAFAHHFHNAGKHANNADVATPTTSGDGRLPSPHLSPNAYFLQELDEQHAMDLDHGAHRGHPTPTSSSHTSSSSSNAYDGGSTTKNGRNAASASTSKSASASRRALPRNEDEFDLDLDAESSDDGGDDSADSDFFELSAARARRQRSSRPAKSGGGGAARRAGASASAPRRPVLSVRVPVRGQSGGGGSGGAGAGHASAGRCAAARCAGAGRECGCRGGGAGAGAPAQMLNASNSAPGGVKAECSNCGATHTPLWRRGLNDELNCNACGLYCKLHKRPRPKTMRNTGGGGEGRGQSVRAEAVDVMAQCYNCHTTATPLWRKDDEGKTVCNAYLHGSARPISMKSDVIRKRSRHDARRGGASASVSETPTASPGVSRRASPAPNGPASSASASAGRASPTLAPDSTTAHSYDTPSELSSALGPKPSYGHPYPYHEQYPDALPFASVDVSSELDAGATQRVNKRRRMSVDSASEPPSSAVSYSSYADGYTSASSQFSMEFPFSRFPNVSYNDGGSQGNNGNNNGARGSGNGNGGSGGLRGGGGANAFWHPPMLLQSEGASANSPGGFLHPPMLPTAEDAPMDYLHPPMVLHNNYNQQPDEENLNNFFGGSFMQTSGLHPPMLPGDESQMGYGMMGGAHPPMLPYEDIYDANGNMHY